MVATNNVDYRYFRVVIDKDELHEQPMRQEVVIRNDAVVPSLGVVFRIPSAASLLNDLAAIIIYPAFGVLPDLLRRQPLEFVVVSDVKHEFVAYPIEAIAQR